MYNFPYQYMVNLYSYSSANFRCTAYYFPEYFPPKSSTTKLKVIGQLLCFHSPGFLLEGWFLYGSRWFTRASCAICPAWDSTYTPFVTYTKMYPLCDFSVILYLSKNSCGIIEICPVHLFVQVKIFHVHEHISRFYV